MFFYYARPCATSIYARCAHEYAVMISASLASLTCLTVLLHHAMYAHAAQSGIVMHVLRLESAVLLEYDSDAK